MKKLYILFTAFFPCILSFGQVGFAGGTASGEILNGSNFTFPATIPAVTNFLVITVAQYHTNYPITVADLTTGKSLTLAISVSTIGGSGVAIYYIANPGSGTHNFAVSTGGSTTNIKATASFYRNVDITAPIATAGRNKNLAGNQDNNPNLSIASGSGEMVVDAMTYEVQVTTSTGDPSQSDIAYINTHGWNSGASFVAVSSSATGVNWSYTSDAPAYWAVAAVSLKPASGLATLPVVLKDFNVQYNKPEVSIDWNVTQETNFSHYEIENSFDGRGFATLAIVQGKAINGLGAQYHYSDRSMPSYASMVYYRLKMVDLDGKSNYSDVKVVRVNGSATATIKTFPNPVTSTLGINFPASWQNKTVNIMVANMAGQVLSKKQFARVSQDETLDVHNLKPGSYQVILQASDDRAVLTILKF